MTFLVASETSNYAQFPHFVILRLAISTCLPPFLGYQKTVCAQLEAIHIILCVYLLAFSRAPQYLVPERPEFSLKGLDNLINRQDFGVAFGQVV